MSTNDHLKQHAQQLIDDFGIDYQIQEPITRVEREYVLVEDNEIKTTNFAFDFVSGVMIGVAILTVLVMSIPVLLLTLYTLGALLR